MQKLSHMDNLIREAKNICDIHNIKPARSRGQNFLVKQEIYSAIISASSLEEEDRVLEVGPGLGFLTERLCDQISEVAAVELDKKIYSILTQKLAHCGNLKLVNADILKVHPEDLFQSDNESINKKYKIVANLPYNITSIFLRRFLAEVAHKPSSMVLMVQKEVAERIVSKPPPSILSVMVQFYSRPEMLRTVSRKSFWPSPRVDSALLEISIEKDLPYLEEDAFFRLVRKSFSSRRKMLKNNLATGYNISSSMAEEILVKAEISPSVRAQELYIEDWKRLFGVVEKNMI